MKISLYLTKKTFTDSQISALQSVGTVSFSKSGEALPVEELIVHATDAEVLALDPDNFGGFEKAKEWVAKVLEATPSVKYISLATTSFGWVDLEYCKKRKIPVSNIPGYSRESVAEHTLAMLLNCAKRIFVTDRRTQKGSYKLTQGFELRGKTLGIIGLGSIGTATAELAKGIGMRVIAFNRTPTSYPGVEMTSLDEVLKRADAIVIHTTHEPSNKKFLDATKLGMLKSGVIVVNTADREIIDEQAMADLLKSGKVDSYALEAEDHEHSPLSGLENMFFLKGFGWYTKEAIQNLYQILVDNIVLYAKGKPRYIVNA